MNRNKLYLLFILLLLGCTVDEHLDVQQPELTTYKVAVIMPQSQQSRWERIANWAMANIADAQKGLPKAVGLKIEWKDEDAADLKDYVRQIAQDDTYIAIIGPSRSVNAEEVAALCYSQKKCLILPIATSTEFQRINAAKGHVWNMVQSDITQCEILLTQAKLSGVASVNLLSCDDDYGKSFSDWFAYQAIELGLEVGSVTTFTSETELRKAVNEQHEQKRNFNRALIFVPGTEEDCIVFDNEIGKLTDEDGYVDFPLLLCSDMMNSATLNSQLKNMRYEGISPSVNPQSGFISAYVAKFGEEPVNGEAHLYDSFLLLSYALTAMNENESINDAILRVVDGRTEWYGSWLTEDIRSAFQMLQQGVTPDLSGVTGDWTFDEKTHASVLNTTYSHWILIDGEYHTIEYLSTDGSGRTTSTIQAWDWQNRNMQSFSHDQKDFEYPKLNERWGVVIGTSDDWANYRHQADALAMYQLLKRHGYDDEHIILIMEDNIAYHPRNIYPGVVKVRADGENLYNDVVVDYKISDISIDDFAKILMGDVSERLPHVVSSCGNDNIIVFWCGHGNFGKLAWGSEGTVYGWQLNGILSKMNEAGKYRKILFSMDACYSGTIGEDCEGIPGVLFMTAANANETSKADMKDPEMGIWLSNGFTRAFQEAIDNNPNISMRDLYYKVARQTVGSHATVYNHTMYGNMFTNTMQEYLK